MLIDPVIAVKLIKLFVARKEGNVATEIENITSVINSLGLAKAAEVVRVFSIKDIFIPVNEVQDHAVRDLWRETLFISAIAAELAAAV